jgi:hypothetical protein
MRRDEIKEKCNEKILRYLTAKMSIVKHNIGFKTKMYGSGAFLRSDIRMRQMLTILLGGLEMKKRKRSKGTSKSESEGDVLSCQCETM